MDADERFRLAAVDTSAPVAAHSQPRMMNLVQLPLVRRCIALLLAMVFVAWGGGPGCGASCCASDGCGSAVPMSKGDAPQLILCGSSGGPSESPRDQAPAAQHAADGCACACQVSAALPTVLINVSLTPHLRRNATLPLAGRLDDGPVTPIDQPPKLSA